MIYFMIWIVKDYCRVEAGKAIDRSIVEAHLRAYLYCGTNVSGINVKNAFTMGVPNTLGASQRE